MNDMLMTMFAKQREFQEKLGVLQNGVIVFNRQEYINLMTLALIREATEALEETRWKCPQVVNHGWKTTQAEDLEAFRDELVDVFHFFMNLCIAAEMDAGDLFSKYCSKHLINHRRQEEGY